MRRRTYAETYVPLCRLSAGSDSGPDFGFPPPGGPAVKHGTSQGGRDSENADYSRRLNHTTNLGRLCRAGEAVLRLPAEEPPDVQIRERRANDREISPQRSRRRVRRRGWRQGLREAKQSPGVHDLPAGNGVDLRPAEQVCRTQEVWGMSPGAI